MADQGASEDQAASGTGDDTNATGTVQTQDQAQNGQVNPAQPPAAEQGRGGWGMFKTLLVRMVIIYMISSFFRRGTTPPPAQGPGGAPAAQVMPASNLFPKDTMMDMYVYLSEQETFTDFSSNLFWLEEELVYGDWTSGMNGDGSYEKSSEVAVPEGVQNNGSWYMHVYFVKAGRSPNPHDPTYQRRFTVYKSKRLNKYKKRKFHTTVNLLTGQADAHPDLIRLPNDTKVEIFSNWHPNMTLNLIDDHTPWTRGSVPAPLDEFIEFEPTSNQYYPVLYFNDYWNMNREYTPLNDTTKFVNVSITYSPMSLFKWQMYAAQGMRSRWYSFMGEDTMAESDEDQDSLKTTFLETSPYLLGLTIIVSLVHSVFEFLAFKNDIQFWRNRKSLEGLSVRSVFFSVFQSLIVLLYVMDNETNFVVRVSVFIGLGIEIWKIQKVTDIKIDRENKWLGIIPKIAFAEKASYTESATKKYDRLAFKYLSWLLFPLLGGYAVYSVVYMEHKSWYSWVLSMLYGFLLTFGFIMMTPQLFINYKMKSVAHLPWRMLTYKALNTFIDDIFAFVIKMPTLYRIGCFRDDIVFFIYLYQKYIYKVDPSRYNEFGVSGDMFDAEGNVIPPPEGDSVPIEGSEPAAEGSEPAETPSETAEAPSETVEAPSETVEAAETSESTEPKPQEEKKND